VAKQLENEQRQVAVHAECFVIMPIADPDGYDKGHFSKVYEDIFKPACETSNFKPVRADEVKQTNLIHLDILQKLIDSPMAICDLSSRNPNVLFELGLRQAFDKPTVLVQENGTPKIFDIAPLRYTEYRRELRYRDVLEDQESIAKAIIATKESTSKGNGVNSIVSILSLAKPATLKEVAAGDSSGLLQLVRAEMSEMRSDFRRAMHMFESANTRSFVGGGGSSVNFRRRIAEARDSLQEAEMMMEKGAPLEVIVNLTGRTQKLLSRVVESDLPKESRAEARHLFMMADNLERAAVSRQEKI
jgi:hypothetical protein